MGSPSVSTHRGLVHWQGLLLLVSLLTFWSPPITAEIHVVSVYTAQGKDVLLRIVNVPPEAVGFAWYKGNTVDPNNIVAFSITTPSDHVSGPGYEGAEMITDDGFLLLKNVSMEDTGAYTVVVYLPDSEKQIGSGVLQVFEHLTGPILVASNNRVRENEDRVVLTCFTRGASVRWLFNDMYLSFRNRMTLTRDHKRLTINPVKREDAGVYKCRAWNAMKWLDSRPFELHVLH
ncbi:cell adhesion molecule CEACAM21-like [Glossophaga mutica]